MMRRLSTAVPVFAVLLAAGLVAASSPPGSAEVEGVREAVEAYLRAHATGDAAHIRPVFHPDSELFYVREGTIATIPSADYMSRFSGEPAEDEAERSRRIVSVDVTGGAAVAKVELDYPDALITDYFTLLREQGEWKIVNKVFHVAPK